MDLVNTLIGIDVDTFEGSIFQNREDVERCVEWETMEPGGRINTCLDLDDDIRAFFASDGVDRGIMEAERFVFFDVFDRGHESVPGWMGEELHEQCGGVPIDMILIVHDVVEEGEICT